MTTRDKKRKRRAHRKMARYFLHEGGFFNNFSTPGSTFWVVAQWHKQQARNLK